MANKITQSEIDAVNVASNAGDTLTGTTTENKRVFDALPEFIITKYNTFVDWVIANFISEDKLTDLNSLTAKYTAAAAVTNGDFKCTLTGLSTLTSGDAVKVSFPPATDKTKVARLSVDGGTNYKNIYDSTNILASEVENKSLELRYNGTQFVNTDTSNDAKLLASTSAATYTPTTIDLYAYKFILISCQYEGNRPLATTLVPRSIFTASNFSDITSAVTVWATSPTTYSVNVYYSGGKLYTKSITTVCTCRVYGIK